MSRYDQNLTNAVSLYGASRGRADERPPREEREKIIGPMHLTRVKLDSQGYDKGGAYWGIGTPLYLAECLEWQQYAREFIRAKDRDEAKAKIRELYPNARFYDEKKPAESLNLYGFEWTDTFGGEANYCWVQRGYVRARDIKHAITQAKRERYSQPLPRHQLSDYGEMVRIDIKGAAVCCFIEYAEDQNADLEPTQ